MPIHLLAIAIIGFGTLQPVPGSGVGASPTHPAATARSTPHPAELVEQARLHETIASLPIKRAARSDAAHLEGLYKTQELITRRLTELGLRPEFNEVDFLGSTRDRSRPLHSIIVDIPGRATVAPGSPRPIVLVSAHLDAVPNSPGADDDATGVAALLEIARILKDEPMDRTLRLCFFNLEEQGMIGSSKYALEVADRIRDRKESIVLMMSLDMLGYYRTEEGTQKTFIPEATGFKSPKEGDFIAVVTTLRHRPSCQDFVKQMRLSCAEAKVVSVDFLPALADLLRSDHAPFLGMGIPSLLITDTAEYRSPHYHKPTDTIETLDMERFTHTVRALTGAIHHAAGPRAEGARTK